MQSTFNWPATDADGVCASQTLGAAGALTLNGALLEPSSLLKTRRVIMGDGIQRTVTITSTDDQTGVDFTITGTDLYGNTVTEVLSGGNNTTVTSVEHYAIITSIVADGAVGTAITVGSGAGGSTRWWTPNRNANPTSISLYLVISGTINVTVQDTPNDINGGDGLPVTAEIFNHPTLAGETSSGSSNYAFPPGAIRLSVASGSGTCAFTIIQAE